MTDKLPLLLAYAISGLALALWPLIQWRLPGMGPVASSTLDVTQDSKWLLRTGVVFGLIITTVLPWWRHDGGLGLAMSLGEAGIFTLLTMMCIAGLLPTTAKAANAAFVRHATTLTFIAFGLLLSFCTLSFTHEGVLQMAWHHWGAYIGPTELMLAGARVMRDFPTQYGLGPTLLIASVCDQSCWKGTFYVTGLLTFAFALLTAFMAARVVKAVSNVQWATILLLCVVCCFFWDANPVLVGSPLVTPSVNGMRFLPALALTALLVIVDRSRSTAKNFPYAVGHMAWALCAVWSIESAFYGTCIWWPYYLMLRQANFQDGRVPTLLRSSAKLMALLASWVACFFSVYWLVYQTTPTVQGIFAYIVNPPGLLPVNYSGSLWFFVAVIGLGTWANLQKFKTAGNSAEFRHGMALSLLAYSTFSYFLGRSHDNNVLNLLPFLLLVLLHARSQAPALRLGLVTGLLAGLMGWLSVFGWNAWSSAVNATPVSWFDDNWANRVMPGPQGGPESFSSATQEVIKRTQSVYADPVTVAGPTANPSTIDARAVWSAFHSPANLHMFLPAIRRDFLERTAHTLRRSGWLLVWKNEPIAVGLVPDFDAVYTRTHSFDMAGYLAIHYTPTPPAIPARSDDK